MLKKIIPLFVLILFLFTSCSDDGITPLKKRSKIAAILDLSGHYKQFGNEAKIGMDMFQSEYNDSEYEIVYLDSKADTVTALRLFDSVSADTNVKAVITLTSWVSNAIAPVAKQKNILHYAIGSAVFNYPGNGNTVRFTGDVSGESTYMIDYLKDYQKIGLMYFDNDYGKGWQTKLTSELGSKLILSKSYTDTDIDFTSILQEMKNAEPEIIVLISTMEAVKITRQAKQLGITSKFLGNRPILTDSLLKEPAAEGLVFTYPDLNENYDPYKKYQTVYKSKPSSFVAEGYDLLTTFYWLTNNKTFNRETVYNAYKGKILNGMFSEINFDDNAQAASKYSLMEIKSGNYEAVK